MMGERASQYARSESKPASGDSGRRYFESSSDVEWAPMRYVIASISEGRPCSTAIWRAICAGRRPGGRRLGLRAVDGRACAGLAGTTATVPRCFRVSPTSPSCATAEAALPPCGAKGGTAQSRPPRSARRGSEGARCACGWGEFFRPRAAAKGGLGGEERPGCAPHGRASF
eukprot:scaffold16941_cov83-Isochrysis_galbana.AAC.2